jgi:hypothetical protein
VGEAGIVGAKNAADKTKQSWKEKQYGKVFKYGSLTLARPMAALVAAPVSVVGGVATAAGGVLSAGASVSKLAWDGAKKIVRGRESSEQKNLRRLANSAKADDDLARKTIRYQRLFEGQLKLADKLSGNGQKHGRDLASNVPAP